MTEKKDKKKIFKDRLKHGNNKPWTLNDVIKDAERRVSEWPEWMKRK
jgi:hypothetical protein